MEHKCSGCKYKSEHQEMMFSPMGVCNRGINLIEAVQNYNAEKCPYKKTNGDKIRSMKDDELAKFLMSNWFTDGVCKNCDGEYDRCGDFEFCTKEILKWLTKTTD